MPTLISATTSYSKAHMFRSLAAASPLELRKWGTYALILLAPGSFVLLPAYWLFRRLAPRAKESEQGGSAPSCSPNSKGNLSMVIRKASPCAEVP